jgi:hypothetical protein
MYTNFGVLRPGNFSIKYINGQAELQGDLVGWAHGEQEREAS